MAAIHRKNKNFLTNVVIVVAYYFPHLNNHVMIDETFILKKKCKQKIEDSFIRQYKRIKGVGKRELVKSCEMFIR